MASPPLTNIQQGRQRACRHRWKKTQKIKGGRGSSRFTARKTLPAMIMGSTEIRSSDRNKDFGKLTVHTVQLAWSAEGHAR